MPQMEIADILKGLDIRDDIKETEQKYHQFSKEKCELDVIVVGNDIVLEVIAKKRAGESHLTAISSEIVKTYYGMTKYYFK